MIRLGILAADPVYQHPDIRRQLADGYELHDFSDWKSYDHATLLEKCRSVEVVLTGRSSPRLPEELKQDFGRLRWLLHIHGTIRHLVDKSMIEAGLIVTNWGDSLTHVAEGAMALLLAQLKQLRHLDEWAKTGQDKRIYHAFPSSLNGRDVGLYGFGPIGRHMARMLEPFEPNIAIYDPYAKDVPSHIRICSSLRELFSTCQLISIHCGLNDQTRDSVNREMLELLPQGGVVVNTARGGIVDEEALAHLVAAGRLRAGIDVIRSEKDWSASPLASLEGAILTKHKVSSNRGYPPGEEPPPKLAMHAVTNLAAYRRGEPLINVITPELYDLKT